MKLAEILNLIAIIIIPIIAVLIGQWLQTRAEKRKDKMHIFKTLMTSRVYGWTQESVYCLNIIDIVFADDREVRNAWKDLYDKTHQQVHNSRRRNKAQLWPDWAPDYPDYDD